MTASSRPSTAAPTPSSCSSARCPTWPSARPGWSGSARASTHRPARRRGAGADLRGARRVRRADRGARRADGSGSVATSATRDAENADVFVAGVRERLGVDARRCCPVPRRRRSSFDGAVRHLRDEPRMPVLVVDIGGGSTELILGASVTRPTVAAHSMDIGSVRLHERHLRSDPPTAGRGRPPASPTSTRTSTPARSSPAGRRPSSGWPAPSPRSPPAVLDLPAYDRDAIDQAVLPVDQVHAMVGPAVGDDRRRTAGAAVACTPAAPT